MTTERRSVVYRGHVQGVGFRLTAMRIAESFAVVGTVRNLDDGAVGLVVEGVPAVVDGYLGAVRESMAGKIRSESMEVVPEGEPPLRGFVILP